MVFVESEMKGGRNRNTGAYSVQPPPAPPSSTAVDSVGEERIKNLEDSEKFEAAQESFEDDGGEEDDLSEAQEPIENLQIVEAEEGERTKLADGYYEIEAVRRKRVRKGKAQYLIKWRGWPEAENTWEPLRNLMQCSDIIDAFEDSLKGGKGKSTRKKRCKATVTRVQTKTKKQPQHGQRSPSAATYNEPSHMIRMTGGPIPFPSLNNFTYTNVNYIMNNVDTSKNVDENGTKMEEREKNELDLKLCELKGAAMVTASGDIDDANRLAIVTSKVVPPVGNTMADELRKTESGRCTGAKKRKSGSVKRFRKDLASCSVDDGPDGVSGCMSLVPVSDQCSYDVNKYEDSKSVCTITQIVKPISYKVSIANNLQDALVAFEAVRSDGNKVIVDNKFLKANNPLLLIEFYEKNLRYSPS